MIENVLTKKGLSIKLKITIKSLISVGIIALAVILPQFVHLVAGAESGIKWLPMYLPVLLGSCLLGWTWGFGIGVLSPVVSFLITLAFGNPMPAVQRLPFMVVELSVLAVVSGLFSKSIVKNAWMAFPAVLLSFVVARSIFMISILIFGSLTPFTSAVIWEQIKVGLLGLVLQAVIVPFIIMFIRHFLVKADND